jgi:hypothetical protein
MTGEGAGHGVAREEKGPTTATTTGTAWRTTHHPPPASRATARGVDCGWNNEEGRTKKRPKRRRRRLLGHRYVFFLSFHFHFTNERFRYYFNY